MAKKKGKSAAQIRRLIQRAESRGQTYSAEGPSKVDDSRAEEQNTIVAISQTSSEASDEQQHRKRKAIAKKLRMELVSIQNDPEMNAKSRRFAKRRAEAIATKHACCPVSVLLSGDYDEADSDVQSEGRLVQSDARDIFGFHEQKESMKDETSKRKRKNPYILFVGQLAYSTTKDEIFYHFQNTLGHEHVQPSTLTVRLLTDPKKKNQSRGMAFVEVSDPELMYSCLTLHHTNLHGRRINVERSAGGGKTSATKRKKITQYRKEQEEYMSETVDRIMSEYIDRGDVAGGGLDEGVIALCKRHSAATVEKALAEYVEVRGNEKDNPSAFLTYLLGRAACDGTDSVAKQNRET